MSIKIFESKLKATEAIPLGSIRKMIVKGREYIITHTTGGFKVAEPLCPHRKEPLHKGKLNAFNELICPLHEYRFNLDTGAEASTKCPDLTLYQIVEKSDGLYLKI